MITLTELRKQFRKRLRKGSRCRVCGRFSKVYKRNMNASAISVMINMYHYSKIHGPKEWVVMNEFIKTLDDKFPVSLRGGEFAKLHHWGIIKIKKDKNGKKSIGEFKLTKKGVMFIKGKIKLPKFVYLLHNEPQSFSNELTTVEETLQNKFDYDKLMNS